jgi:hypothetical protein
VNARWHIDIDIVASKPQELRGDEMLQRLLWKVESIIVWVAVGVIGSRKVRPVRLRIDRQIFYTKVERSQLRNNRISDLRCVMHYFLGLRLSNLLVVIQIVWSQHGGEDRPRYRLGITS